MAPYAYASGDPVDETDQSGRFAGLNGRGEAGAIGGVGPGVRIGVAHIAAAALALCVAVTGNVQSCLPHDKGPCLETLFHYTTHEGAAAIVATDFLKPSLGTGKNTKYGEGVYFTDLPPETPYGTIGAYLYGSPRYAGKRRQSCVQVNVCGLAIEHPAPHVYLYPTTVGLDLLGRLLAVLPGPTKPAKYR